jgi:hypothetical protein
MENGSIENINTAIYFQGDENFAALAPGTDTNLLLCSLYSGVWAIAPLQQNTDFSANNRGEQLDTDNGVLENRVPLAEIGIEIGETPVGFLPDGRLLIIKPQADGGSSLFKYVPAGR